jgi:molybdenum cofactor cytidylyltransferase
VKFGLLPLAEAEGALLAHAVRAGPVRLRKGQRLGPEEIARLAAAGIDAVIGARLEPGDLDENQAAAAIAEALHAPGIEVKPAATGRVNLHAETAGIVVIDRLAVDRLNAVDSSITIATLSNHSAVQAGQMVATVKIIPFAVAGRLVDAAVALARKGTVITLKPFRAHRVGLIQTTLDGVKAGVLDKTARVMAERLEKSHSAIVAELRPPHEVEAVASAIRELHARSDLLVIFGASATSDDGDVVPAAIRLAGGRVERTGMPVDPGNLLVLGHLDGRPVIGAPGCARSPKENGFDWILDRLLAGVDVTAKDIAGMGVGGLLMEIPSRPQPREGVVAGRKDTSPAVHAIVLAAGRSRRMGGPNKLFARIEGETLIRRTVRRICASGVSGVTVVTGHQAPHVMAALEGLEVSFAHNPDYADGLSTSLKTGIAAVPANAAAVLVALGDMPGVTTADINRLLAAFGEAGGRTAVRATFGGKRGNPIILPRVLFPEIVDLAGDVGARHIVERYDAVLDVEIGRAAALDVDTPEALADAGGVFED